MADSEEKVVQLLSKLENLLERQEGLTREVNDLRREIESLQGRRPEKGFIAGAIAQDPELKAAKEEGNHGSITSWEKCEAVKEVNGSIDIKSNIEKFIGESLISKIGIAITVLGIAIGAKYSIEHNLIAPSVRILLGYLAGIVLLGLGLFLRKNYWNYSAVLVSGGTVIMYFITYIGYGLFGLIPQSLAFLLMITFTALTILAAWKYDRQIIAHFGLVGAYTIPFLLDEGSGKIAILFSYISIINLGILVISLRKYWKPLYYSSFSISWVIYLLWFVSEYHREEHFGLALTYAFILFITFYFAFLAYKLVKKERFGIENVILLLANSFIFYGVGYAILESHGSGKHLLGLFTVFNGLVHSIVATMIYRNKFTDRSLFHLVLGVALIFMTIAIPVQLDGNWVTLLWAGEAAALFWIGRVKGTNFYEKLSYILMFLAFFSLVQDWYSIYGVYVRVNPKKLVDPFFNITFFSSLLVICSFGFINYINSNKKYYSPIGGPGEFSAFMSLSIPAIFLLVLYCTFRLEIGNYWQLLYANSSVPIDLGKGEFSGYYRNDDLMRFKTVWTNLYTIFFVMTLSFFNMVYLKVEKLGLANLGLNVMVLTVFLVQGLYTLGELRNSYLEQSLSQYYQRGFFNIGIRYVAIVFVAILLIVCQKYTRQHFIKRGFKVPIDLFVHLTILWIMSSELVNWIDIMGHGQPYKLGLSILWGVYSLMLVILGIWKRKRHLRIAAITLFGITLAKIFAYDMLGQGTIPKTITFVSLGVLLLITSFLYNKYKGMIYEEIEECDSKKK